MVKSQLKVLMLFNFKALALLARQFSRFEKGTIFNLNQHQNGVKSSLETNLMFNDTQNGAQNN